MDYLTNADLLRLTNARRRTLQFLADNGALKALPSTEGRGHGVHRRYPPSESLVAYILAYCVNFGVTIKTLIEIGEAVRLASKMHLTNSWLYIGQRDGQWECWQTLSVTPPSDLGIVVVAINMERARAIVYGDAQAKAA